MAMSSWSRFSKSKKWFVLLICFGNGWKLWEVGSKEMILRLGMIATGLEVALWGFLRHMEDVIPKLAGSSGLIQELNKLLLLFGTLKNLSPALILASAGDLGGIRPRKKPGTLMSKIYTVIRIPTAKKASDASKACCLWSMLEQTALAVYRWFLTQITIKPKKS